MAKLTTRERVDRFWSTTFDLSPDDLHRPGARIQAHNAARQAWRGIYVLAFADAATIFAPADLVADLRTHFGDAGAAAATDPARWRALLPKARVLGPSRHHYLDEAGALANLATGRRLNPGDFSALSSLSAAVGEADWESSGFAGQPAVLFGLFDSGEMVAAANLGAGPEAASDVGVATRPDRRGRGFGTRVAATAAKQALAMHGIARYRALATNPASLAIASRLGFDEYGQNLAIAL
jgi:hypothetical protein